MLLPEMVFGESCLNSVGDVVAHGAGLHVRVAASREETKTMLKTYVSPALQTHDVEMVIME